MLLMKQLYEKVTMYSFLVRDPHFPPILFWDRTITHNSAGILLTLSQDNTKRTRWRKKNTLAKSHTRFNIKKKDLLIILTLRLNQVVNFSSSPLFVGSDSLQYSPKPLTQFLFSFSSLVRQVDRFRRTQSQRVRERKWDDGDGEGSCGKV